MADIFETQDNEERAVKEEVKKEEDQAEHNHGVRPHAKRKYGKKTADCACPCKYTYLTATVL